MPGAEREYERALLVAESRDALGLQLYTAVRLVRLWHRQGRNDDAGALLAPLYDRFIEGHDISLSCETPRHC